MRRGYEIEVAVWPCAIVDNKKDYRANMLTHLYRFIPVLGVLVFTACSVARPELSTLYQTSQGLADQPPVILVHGAFGGRLCDEQGGEHWPGGVWSLLFDEYSSLALPLGESSDI